MTAEQLILERWHECPRCKFLFLPEGGERLCVACADQAELGDGTSESDVIAAIEGVKP